MGNWVRVETLHYKGCKVVKYLDPKGNTWWRPEESGYPLRNYCYISDAIGAVDYCRERLGKAVRLILEERRCKEK